MPSNHVAWLREFADQTVNYADFFIRNIPGNLRKAADRIEALEAGLQEFGYADHYGDQDGLDNCDRNPFAHSVPESEVPESHKDKPCTCGAAEQNVRVTTLLEVGR